MYPISSKAALKAVELDDTLPEAHAMAGVLKAYEYDWKGAQQEFLRALELDAESLVVWNLNDLSYLAPRGRVDEAMEASRKAVACPSRLLHRGKVVV